MVEDHNAGRRVDVYLSSRFPSFSRTAIAREIQAGNVLDGDRALKRSSQVRAGQSLRLFVPTLAPEGPPPPLPQVLFEDDRIIVVNKPPDLLCHPAGIRFEYGVIGLVRDAWPDARIDLCHRLDRDTSGVLVLTKDVPANAFIKAAFKARSLRKVYLALVHGRPSWDAQDVRAPIGDDTTSEVRLRRGVVPDGQPAHTDVTVVQRLDGLSLVSCRIHTGRTHQIRVHLEHLGHPVVGDRLYGQPDDVFLEYLDHGATDRVRAAVGFPRQCLHAAELELPHPDGHTLFLEAPLPADMAAVVAGGPVVWEAP